MTTALVIVSLLAVAEGVGIAFLILNNYRVKGTVRDLRNDLEAAKNAYKS